MEDNQYNLPFVELTSTYDIYAAHQLSRPEWTDSKNREVFGQCADLHGHQYKLVVVLEGRIQQDSGMIVNGYEMDRIVKEKVLTIIDHKFINDADVFFKDHLTTVEWIACWIFGKLKNEFPPHCRLKTIQVYETPSLFAVYSGS